MITSDCNIRAEHKIRKTDQTNQTDLSKTEKIGTEKTGTEKTENRKNPERRKPPLVGRFGQSYQTDRYKPNRTEYLKKILGVFGNH